MSELENVLSRENIKEKDVDFSRSMIDYYAVTMLVMIIFMSASIGGANIIYEGRKTGTLSRMMISPKNRTNLYIQTALSSLPQTFIQALAVMIPSVFIFGAHYSDNMNDNIILFVMFVAVGAAIGSAFTLIGIFIKSNPSMVIMPIMWVLMFISGTFSKEIYIKGVTERMPIWLIQNAAFDLTVFGNNEKAVTVMIVSAIIVVLATGAGAFLFRRKRLVP